MHAAEVIDGRLSDQNWNQDSFAIICEALWSEGSHWDNVTSNNNHNLVIVNTTENPVIIREVLQLLFNQWINSLQMVFMLR